VPVANVGHVTALADVANCAPSIVRRFVRTTDPGDTSCARSATPRVRMVPAFPRSWRGFPAARGAGPTPARRIAEAAVHTVGDVVPRWFAMYGVRGRGLRGGTFTTTGIANVSFHLRRLRLVTDLAVSGHVGWDRATGTGSARLRLVGGATGRLALAWNDATGVALVRGRVNGHPVHVRTTAP
jgi:hypothetical protein